MSKIRNAWRGVEPTTRGLILFAIAIVMLSGIFGVIVFTGESYQEMIGAGTDHSSNTDHSSDDAISTEAHWRPQVFKDALEAGTPIAAEDDLNNFLRMIPISCKVAIEHLTDDSILLLYGCP